MPIRVRLQAILDERGMSQRELARLMNVRPNNLQVTNNATRVVVIELGRILDDALNRYFFVGLVYQSYSRSLPHFYHSLT